MSAKPNKLLARMRNNPAGDWTMDDLRTLCRQVGAHFDAPKRGSHFVVWLIHPANRVVIPARRPVKTCYIRDLVRLIEKYGPEGT